VQQVLAAQRLVGGRIGARVEGNEVAALVRKSTAADSLSNWYSKVRALTFSGVPA